MNLSAAHIKCLPEHTKQRRYAYSYTYIHTHTSSSVHPCALFRQFLLLSQSNCLCFCVMLVILIASAIIVVVYSLQYRCCCCVLFVFVYQLPSTTSSTISPPQRIDIITLLALASCRRTLLLAFF